MKHYDSIFDKIEFGMHSGNTIEYLALNDPQYLWWLIDTNIIDLSDEVLEGVLIYSELSVEEEHVFNEF